MSIRPPHVGWLIVLGWALAILVAAGSALYGLYAHRLVRQAEGVLIDFAQLQCVPVKPGSEVRVYPPRSDTLRRAARP